MEPLADEVLPAGVRSRILPGINGLDVHVLKAGHDAPAGAGHWVQQERADEVNRLLVEFLTST